MKKTILILLTIIFLSTIIFFIYENSKEKPYIEMGGKKIFVEIADTPQEREIGLMRRENLCENCGMFFIFENADYYNFWMKNTKIPLDIIFINSDFEIIDIISASPCGIDLCQTYTPKQKALYVLEINEGLFDSGIVGEKIRLSF